MPARAAFDVADAASWDATRTTIRGTQLGFDGGQPTMQRGGITIPRRGSPRPARIGASAHTPKFVLALGNRAVGLRASHVAASHVAVTQPDDTPQLWSPPAPLPSVSAPDLWFRGPGSSSRQAGTGAPVPGLPPRSPGAGLKQAEADACAASAGASAAAAAVRQAIWARSSRLPCPAPPRKRVGSVLELMDVVQRRGSSSMWELRQPSNVPRHSGVSRRKRIPQGGPSLSRLAAKGQDGIMEMLSLARCDTKFYSRLTRAAGNARDIIGLGDVGLAEAGLSAPERRRVLKLLRSAAEYDGTTPSTEHTCAM